MTTTSMINRAEAYVIDLEEAEGIYGGREIGTKVFRELFSYIEETGFDSTVPIDFRYVKFIDVSCADEIVCKLVYRVKSGELGTRFIFLENLNMSVRETIHAALTIRKLACLLRTGEERFAVLGQISKPLKEALDLVLDRKKVIASEVAETLSTTINTACNRLNTLRQLGLICRLHEDSSPGGGRLYYYESIV
ncbi:MAG: hypothetical protein HY731_05475 [Candidatus Tectomicrobia bacterium]|nr:hypothetical protein [Candidatus Tectomicrobia bacterium]